MPYATDSDRATMREAAAVRCVCTHWAAIHVVRDGQRACTAARCDCNDFLERRR